MVSQELPRDDRDGVPLVVHVYHASPQLPVDKIGEVLVPNAGHPVAHHAHGHIRTELQLEEEAVEEGECCAERVADGGDGRCALGPEGRLDGREDGERRTVCATFFNFCQLGTEDHRKTRQQKPFCC